MRMKSAVRVVKCYPVDDPLWTPYLNALVPMSHRVKSVILDPTGGEKLLPDDDIVASPDGYVYGRNYVKSIAQGERGQEAVVLPVGGGSVSMFGPIPLKDFQRVYLA